MTDLQKEKDERKAYIELISKAQNTDTVKNMISLVESEIDQDQSSIDFFSNCIQNENKLIDSYTMRITTVSLFIIVVFNFNKT